MPHIPVLLKETIEYLDPKPNENFIDATLGNGGHAIEILKKIAPNGKLLGIDWNEDAIEKIKTSLLDKSYKNRLITFCGNFADIKEIVRETKFINVMGILADLGISTEELEESGRGFSFLRDEPLIMTYSNHPSSNMLTAEKIINTFSEEKLADIFYKFGEERRAKVYSHAIAIHRAKHPIRRSRELAKIIENVTPRRIRGIHPATRIFQALRIAVNNELENLTQLLNASLEILKPHGRMVFISYHSLEDRIIKNTFKRWRDMNMIRILTPKPMRPSYAEIIKNRRSRSAKLRSAEKL